jgi:hypothetical protein
MSLHKKQHARSLSNESRANELLTHLLEPNFFGGLTSERSTRHVYRGELGHWYVSGEKKNVMRAYTTRDVMELVEDGILEPVHPDEDGQSTAYRVRGRA